MEETKLAEKIAEQVVSDTKFWIALIGVIGAVIGSLLTIAGNVLLHWLKVKPNKKVDEARKELLTTMLEDDRFKDRWRYLSTLSGVIGADEETTKRLLIELNARGSEKNDGKWGFIKYHPFNKTEQ